MNSKYSKKNDIMFCEIQEQGVLLDLKSNKYFSLNEVANFIWNKIDLGLTVEEMVNCLSLDYEINFEKCQKDVKNLINEMLERGFIEKV